MQKTASLHLVGKVSYAPKWTDIPNNETCTLTSIWHLSLLRLPIIPASIYLTSMKEVSYLGIIIRDQWLVSVCLFVCLTHVFLHILLTFITVYNLVIILSVGNSHIWIDSELFRVHSPTKIGVNPITWLELWGETSKKVDF